jgi:hypothetical protein
MSALIKLLVGAVLMVAAVWWVVQGSDILIQRSGLIDLVSLLNGGIPLGIFLIGIFVVWLELDEIRIEREIKAEEKKSKKKK